MIRISKIFFTLVLLMAGLCQLAAQECLPRPAKDDVAIGNAVASMDNRELVVDYQVRLGRNIRYCDVGVMLLVGESPEGVQLNESDLTGKIKRLSRSGSYQFRYNVEKDRKSLADKDITFQLVVTDKKQISENYFVMASTSVYPQFSLGAMFGFVRGWLGGYAKYRSNFKNKDTAFTCTSDGKLENGGPLWTTASPTRTRMSATGGLMFGVSKSFFPYIGVGYGERNVFWKDYDMGWVKVTDYSCKGVSAEVGAIFKIKHFAFSIGASTTCFKYTDIDFGIGVAF